MERAHRERCRTRERKKKKTKINFVQTGESFTTEDVTNSQMSEMAKRMRGCKHTKCIMSALLKASE